MNALRLASTALAVLFLALLKITTASARNPWQSAHGLRGKNVHSRKVLQAGGGAEKGTALQEAVYGGDLKTVASLAAAGADVNQILPVGVTPLYLATAHGNADMVKMLLALMADPNVKSEFGAAPLHKAALLGDAECAAILIGAGAKVSTPGPLKLTALHYAAFGDIGQGYNREDLRFTIGGHGSKEVSGDKFVAPKYSLLNQFQNRKIPNHLEVVWLLIRNLADVNALTEYGETPLHYVAVHDQFYTADVLISAGALVNVADTQMETPLHEATGYGAQGVVQALLLNGADSFAKEQHDLDPRQFICRCRKYHGMTDLNHCAPGKCISFFDTLVIESLIDKVRDN